MKFAILLMVLSCVHAQSYADKVAARPQQHLRQLKVGINEVPRIRPQVAAPFPVKRAFQPRHFAQPRPLGQRPLKRSRSIGVSPFARFWPQKPVVNKNQRVSHFVAPVLHDPVFRGVRDPNVPSFVYTKAEDIQGYQKFTLDEVIYPDKANDRSDDNVKEDAAADDQADAALHIVVPEEVKPDADKPVNPEADKPVEPAKEPEKKDDPSRR